MKKGHHFHLSEETKARMSESRKGKRHSSETKDKIRISNQTYARKTCPSWQEGRGVDCKGYVWIAVPLSDGTIVRRSEHVLIAERVLGRRLNSGEVVHHINGNKADNRNSNLLITTNSYHRWLETKMATLYKTEHFEAAPNA